MRGIPDKGLLLATMIVSHGVCFGMQNLLSELKPAHGWMRPVSKVVHRPRPPVSPPVPAPAPPPPPLVPEPSLRPGIVQTAPRPRKQASRPARQAQPPLTAVPPQERRPAALRPVLRPVAAVTPGLVPVRLGLAPSRGTSLAAPRVAVPLRLPAAVPGLVEPPVAVAVPAPPAKLRLAGRDICQGQPGVRCFISGLGNRALREPPQIPRPVLPRGVLTARCLTAFTVDRFGSVVDAAVEFSPFPSVGTDCREAVASLKFVPSAEHQMQRAQFELVFEGER